MSITSKEPDVRQISKKLFSLALPMAITQLIAIGSGFLCMAMLARLGHDVLAASALIFSARISIIIIGASILFSLSILIGHAFGEKEYARIGNFMQQGWTLAILISLPTLVLFWNIHSILLFFGQSKSLVDIVQVFFHANVWNVFPFMLAVCNQQLCYGTRKQKIDLFANLVGVSALLLSAYLLIFGHLGFPKLGVKGLGYALSLQSWCYFLFTSCVLFFSDYFKRFDLFTYRVHQNWHYILQMFRVGWPISLQIGGEMLSFFITAAMIGWLGARSLAAFQVVNQYQMLVIIPLFALAQASGVLVGQAKGAKNFYEIKKLGNAAMFFSLTITVVVACLFVFFPKWLAALYLTTTDPTYAQTLHLIIILFSIVAIAQIFDGLRNVITGALRGLFDTKYPMYIGLLAIWVIGIPLGYLLAFQLHLGVAGIIVGSASGMFVGAFLLIQRWKKLIKNFSMPVESAVPALEVQGSKE